MMVSGRDDGGDSMEQSTAEHLALGGQPAALVIGESQAPTSELFPEHAVLLDEVSDDVCLFAVHPAGEGGEEELEREGIGHRA